QSSPQIPAPSLHDALPILNGHALDVSVTGSGTAQGPWLITFNNPYHDVTLTADDAGLLLAGGNVNVEKSAASSTRVQTISVAAQDRKSTRLNSSHEWISYA